MCCNCKHRSRILAFLFQSFQSKFCFEQTTACLFLQQPQSGLHFLHNCINICCNLRNKGKLTRSLIASSVCWSECYFVQARCLTSGEQAHIESAGTNSSTNFQSVSCWDMRETLSRLHQRVDMGRSTS